MMLLGACALRGPEGIELAPQTYLKLTRGLVFVGPQETVNFPGDRRGAPVLGAVLTTDETPRMLVLYDDGVDERGHRRVQFGRWGDAPGTELATTRK